MNELEDSFAKLLGKQPSDHERQRLYQVRDALGLQRNDALWLVLMALQHYESHYEVIPSKIEEAARKTLESFRDAAGAAAIASAEAAKEDLARAVAVTARDVARNVAVTSRLQWVGMTVTLCSVALGAAAYIMYTRGLDAGERHGYVAGYEEAKDESAAASWATTTRGRAVYELAKKTDVMSLVECSRPGWKIEEGVCFPYRAADGTYGWRVK